MSGQDNKGPKGGGGSTPKDTRPKDKSAGGYTDKRGGGGKAGGAK